MVAWLLGDG